MYGREEAGLLDEEVAACDCAVSIPIGRLQESLSLSHAVSITLSQLYQVPPLFVSWVQLGTVLTPLLHSNDWMPWRWAMQRLPMHQRARTSWQLGGDPRARSADRQSPQALTQ